MAAPTTLRLVDPEQPEKHLASTEIDLDEGSHAITFDDNDFYRNLANDIGDEELSRIASELLTGIELDLQSRKEWLESRATGIRLLGLKIEEPRGDMGTSSVPLEGMSTIRHPLLLEATVRFQATARGEFLPATGTVKVRNDLPMKPEPPAPPPGAPPMPGPVAAIPPGIGHNNPPPEGQAMDDLGSALEKD